jgi:hypothetical protein
VPDFADYWQYLPDGSRQPCYAPAFLVLVRPNGETLGFSCADHLPAKTAPHADPRRHTAHGDHQ